ncbi:HypC/HybG/HupF family hydrogenase formation chaperone [Skermania sp. ID1734]|uniref:HypC/HybG/HupF family hydrogenase formation chaperone n=1 Tax=Skermania sp. ID1734 TaxID=2597516 RepID=UPI00117C7365|nr:HypC/HybG/HupF family hydrogenase formation chaperone [Skermania sp. ID1734]TSE00944.1 HypC/HybG/HupF family hydrogenase formation chaperone [Skermania sp. ID1734]
MCLSVPREVVAIDADRPGLAQVSVGTQRRSVNVGLLDAAPNVGDWVLVHLGFALSTIDAAEAHSLLATLHEIGPQEGGRP